MVVFSSNHQDDVTRVGIFASLVMGYAIEIILQLIAIPAWQANKSAIQNEASN